MNITAGNTIAVIFAGLLSSGLVGCIASPSEIGEGEGEGLEHASASSESNARTTVEDETAGAISAPVATTGDEIPAGGGGGGAGGGGGTPTGKPQPSPWRPTNPSNPGQSNTVAAPGTVSPTSIQAPQPSPWTGQGPQPGSNGPTAELYTTAQQQ